ncbi:efflux RND transporter periplasmic adaptor subunit [Leptospira sp. severe_002]|uniref:efflux RND transporter periplasmic adaptor subunit n=1 Tax=Leptospira sp. severe_002 TaxID=2838237 RepID=UPI001E297F91|nr:efflux RND transporter periplasmic adaptor subunit [Leptospira sp. severe_002]
MSDRKVSARVVLVAGLLGFSLQACSEGPAAPADPTPQEVSIVTMQPTARAYVRELPGRIAPTRIAEVRARVSGIVIERNFEQGSNVNTGDVLYRLDPAPFEVELQATEAALAKAEAVAEQAGQQAKRMETLLTSKTVSDVQHEAATATMRQANADVAARKADVARAKLNLSYTVIRAPIAGRIGRALITEGALVGQNETTHLATIQALDTVYADFTQSVAEMNQLRRAFESGDLEMLKPDAANVRLILDDNEAYSLTGRLLFSDTTVDRTTGQVTLRGEFSNPKGELLPGMFVRVQIEQGIDPDALSVPQQAVRRNDAGGSELFVLRDDNRAVVRPVRVGRVVDDQWLVLEGVKPGERVVVEGFQKFVPGDTVSPKPWRGVRVASEADKESEPNVSAAAR